MRSQAVREFHLQKKHSMLGLLPWLIVFGTETQEELFVYLYTTVPWFIRMTLSSKHRCLSVIG